MLRRKMERRLEEWAGRWEGKALMLLGARQTGKTFLVRRFAEKRFPGFVEVNFLERKGDAEFLAASDGAADFISRLSMLEGRVVPPGTLIFLDEIQQAGRELVTMAKFLVEDGAYPLVLSGSLLGTVLGGIDSFPVGYVQMERMYPLDFEEFCWAMGVPQSVLDTVRRCYDQKLPLEETLHGRLISLFRQHVVTGGMPEAVQSMLDNGRNLAAARQVCTEIGANYRYDVSKYAGDRRVAAITVWDNVPSQLSKENKRYQMQSVKSGAVYDRIRDDFAWLVDAGVVLPAYVVTEPRIPLARTKVAQKFKLYSSDCGMLLSRYPQASSVAILQGGGDQNYGAVYENVVAQNLAALGFELCYYNNSRKGEVDFLLETSAGRVLPVEVKSGKDYKIHLALNNLLGTEGFPIDCAYVLSEANVSVGQKSGKPVYYLPLYMVMCIGCERSDLLGDIRLEEIAW